MTAVTTPSNTILGNILDKQAETKVERCFLLNTDVPEKIASPAWNTFRAESLSSFKKQSLPTKKQEIWKYEDLSKLTETEYSRPTGFDLPEAENIQKLFPVEATDVCLIFVNGQLIHQTNTNVLTILPLEEALKNSEIEAKVLKCLSRDEIKNAENPFIALNYAQTQTGLYVQIPEGRVLSERIIMFFYSTDAQQEFLTAPLIFIDSEKASDCKFKAVFIGKTNQNYFNNAVVYSELAEAAKVSFTTILSEGNQAKHFMQHVAFLAENSQFTQKTFTLSGLLTRQSLDVYLQGKGAHAYLLGLSVLTNEMQAHQHLRLHHQVPGCTSEQSYKGILCDKTIYDFDGMIHIPKHAVQTEANQLNNNLLLSRDAKVYTRPQLKIDADDVKCSHGATVGQLNQQELFYLQSRGIPAKAAKSILTQGFANELIQRVKDTQMQHWLYDRVLFNLASSPQ